MIPTRVWKDASLSSYSKSVENESIGRQHCQQKKNCQHRRGPTRNRKFVGGYYL